MSCLYCEEFFVQREIFSIAAFVLYGPVEGAGAFATLLDLILYYLSKFKMEHIMGVLWH
jgi:hypothetical protein